MLQKLNWWEEFVIGAAASLLQTLEAQASRTRLKLQLYRRRFSFFNLYFPAVSGASSAPSPAK